MCGLDTGKPKLIPEIVSSGKQRPRGFSRELDTSSSEWMSQHLMGPRQLV